MSDPEDDTKTPLNLDNEVESASPFSQTDLKQWAKMPFWNTFEASCLTYGFEPNSISQIDRSELEKYPDDLSKVEFRIELFSRAIEMEELSRQIRPAEALDYLDARDETYPGILKEITSKIKHFGTLVGFEQGKLRETLQAISDIKPSLNDSLSPPQKAGMTKKIDSLERLLLTVCVEFVCFDPDKPQNPTFKMIEQAMHQHEIKPLKPDTIRAHLHRSADNHWNAKDET